MKKKILIDEQTQYDYWKNPNKKFDFIMLTQGKKCDVILFDTKVLVTFIKMGDEGFLKGQAYIDYTNLKERKENEREDSFGKD